MELPFNLKPTLSTYLYMGYPFGILENPAVPNGLLNLNVQLMFQREIYGPYIHNLVIYPTLDFQHYSRLGLFHQRIHASGRVGPVFISVVNDIIIKCLSHGRYVYLFADYFYLPGTGNYTKSHFRHDLLIYGHDHNAASYKGALFTKDGILNSIDIPYDFATKAFGSPYARGKECADYCKDDLLLSLAPSRRSNVEEVMDFAGILAQVKAYLASSSVFKLHRKTLGEIPDKPNSSNIGSPSGRVCFGVSIYPEILRYFEERIGGTHPRFDLRITRLLWEHKKLMGIRLRRLADEGRNNIYDIAHQWLEVEALARFVHLGAFAAKRGRAADFLTNLQQQLPKLRSQESMLLERLLKNGARLRPTSQKINSG